MLFTSVFCGGCVGVVMLYLFANQKGKFIGKQTGWLALMLTSWFRSNQSTKMVIKTYGVTKFVLCFPSDICPVQVRLQSTTKLTGRGFSN